MYYLMQKLTQSAEESRHEIFVDSSPEVKSASLQFTPTDLSDEIDMAALQGTPGSPAAKRTQVQMSHSLKALRYLAQERNTSGSLLLQPPTPHTPTHLSDPIRGFQDLNIGWTCVIN